MNSELLEHIQKCNYYNEMRRHYPSDTLLYQCVEHYAELIKATSVAARKAYNNKRLQECTNKSKVWNIVNDG